MDPNVIPHLHIKSRDLELNICRREVFHAAATELVPLSEYAPTVHFHRLYDGVPIVESAWEEERWVQRFVSGFVRCPWMWGSLGAYIKATYDLRLFVPDTLPGEGIASMEVPNLFLSSLGSIWDGGFAERCTEHVKVFGKRRWVSVDFRVWWSEYMAGVLRNSLLW